MFSKRLYSPQVAKMEGNNKNEIYHRLSACHVPGTVLCVLHVCGHLNSPHNPVGELLFGFLILDLRKHTLREVKKLAQAHIASKW